MDQFVSVYNLIKDLRASKVKMKDIAAYINLPASVLSALYSTVFPVYINCRNDGMGAEESLKYALSLVNNVSHKRVVSNIKNIEEKLKVFNIAHIETSYSDSFSFTDFTEYWSERIKNYLGIYQSYSLSSRYTGLKIEPFLFSLKEGGNRISVIRKNTNNSINEGVSVIDNGHTMYILLNEGDNKQLSLVVLYLQLPLHENPNFLRGLYLALDYSRNPIARRVVLVKISDEQRIEKLSEMESKIVPEKELTPELQPYYDYTSGNTDNIRMLSLPSVYLTIEDLSAEKEMLSILSSLTR